MSWEFYMSGLGNPHAHWNTQAYRKVYGCMVDTSKFSSLYIIGPDRDGDSSCPIKVTPFIIQLKYGWVGGKDWSKRFSNYRNRDQNFDSRNFGLPVCCKCFETSLLTWLLRWMNYEHHKNEYIYIYILPMIVEANIIANQKYRLQWSSILNWKLRMIWVTINNRQKKLQQI